MKYRIALLSTIATLAAASIAEAQTVVTYPRRRRLTTLRLGQIP